MSGVGAGLGWAGLGFGWAGLDVPLNLFLQRQETDINTYRDTATLHQAAPSSHYLQLH